MAWPLSCGAAPSSHPCPSIPVEAVWSCPVLPGRGQSGGLQAVFIFVGSHTLEKPLGPCPLPPCHLPPQERGGVNRHGGGVGA